MLGGVASSGPPPGGMMLIQSVGLAVEASRHTQASVASTERTSALPRLALLPTPAAELGSGVQRRRTTRPRCQAPSNNRRLPTPRSVVFSPADLLSEALS